MSETVCILYGACTCRTSDVNSHYFSSVPRNMLIYCSCIQDEELARQLVELGYRGSGEVLKREEFEARKLAAAASKLARRDQQRCVILIYAVADTVTFESHTVVSLSLFNRIHI